VEVLFVAADLPWPPDGGGKIATLRVLEAFARGRTVDLVALADPIAPQELQPLESICRSVTAVPHPFTFGRHRVRQLSVAARAAFSPQPYRLQKFKSAPLASAIASKLAAGRYDLIHFDQLGVASYHNGRYPTTFAAQNVESSMYDLGAKNARGRLLRGWARLEALKLLRAERSLYRRFGQVFAMSRIDGALLEKLGVSDPIVLPIPFDVDIGSGEPPPRPTVLSLGSMSWFGVEDGMLWFHEKVLPIIRRSVPDVRWTLVGPNAGSRIRQLSDGDRVVVAGYLPSIEPVLAESRVCIVPIHVGGGVRIKLIEMFAKGRPAVATTVGAQGLRFLDGEGCFRRDDPEAFAAAVVSLLQDDDLWRRTVQAGARWVREHHNREAMDGAVALGIANAQRRFRNDVQNR
jgi:glycosyltransferase involved in cell wall biosynthesis